MNTDLGYALATCAFVVIIFAASLLVPRRGGVPAHTNRKLDALQKRVDHVEALATKASHDVANVRASIPVLATKEHVARVEVQVANVHGEVKTIAANSAASSHSLKMIQEFLLKAAAEAVVTNKRGEG